MVAVHLEIGTDKMRQFIDPLFVRQKMGGEFLVEECTPCAHVVHFSHGLRDRCRPQSIGPLNGRNTLGEGFCSFSPVGSGSDNIPEIDMHRGGEEVDPVIPSFRIGPSVYGIEIRFEYGLHDIVGIVVVVSVFGGFVEKPLPQRLLSFEVVLQSREQTAHADMLFVVHIVFDRRQDIGHAPEPHSLNIVGVVAGSPVMVVLPICDAVIDQQGKKRRRQIFRVQPLDDVIARDLDIGKVLQLLLISFEEFVERREPFRTSGLEANTFTCAGIHPIVQGDLEHLGHVEIPGKDIAFFPESPGLNTSARPAVPGVLDRFPLPHQFLDNGIGVENRWLPEAGLHDLQRPFQKPIRIFFAYLDHGTGLENPHFLHHIQDQIGEFIHSVRTIRLDSA